MSRWNKRPQNACRRCHYTWYPRGKQISYSCPRCGSRDVELAIMAFFRLIAEMVLAVFLVLKVLIEAIVALVGWIIRLSGKMIHGVLQWFTNRIASQGKIQPGIPSQLVSSQSSPPVPKLRKSFPAYGWISRCWYGLLRATATFFYWVASVNDDLMGVNTNPHPLGILAKLLVIIALAAIAFVGVLFIFRGSGLL